jgi:glucan phosphoethanolaminetransferase (alkaline phosphatase superfamily)
LFSRFSFWIQLFFGAVSGIVLLFAMLGRNMSEQTNNAGIGFGVLLAIFGLLLLCFRIFWDFRYRLLGRLLHA